ncbi:MAG: hypothetical protein OHK0057_13420 [Thermoflexibacter sp.]
MCYKNKVKNDKYNIDKTFPFSNRLFKAKITPYYSATQFGLSYRLNEIGKEAKNVKTEYGEKDF